MKTEIKKRKDKRKKQSQRKTPTKHVCDNG